MHLPHLQPKNRLWIERALAVAAIAFFIWFSAFHILQNERSRAAGKIDFVVFYSAGKMVTRNDVPAVKVYSRKVLLSVIHEVRKKKGPGVFLYPPPAAVIFVPLSVLNFKLAVSVWAVISSCAVIAAYYLTIGVLLADRITRIRYSVILAVLVLTDTLHSLFFYGQINGALLLLMIGGFAALSKNKAWLSGFLLSTATVLKIFPILFFPYLLIKKQWTAAISFVLTGIGWFALALPFFHWNGILYFFTNRIPHVLGAGVGYVNESTSLFGSFRASVRQHHFDWLSSNTKSLIDFGEKALPAISVLLLVGAGIVLLRARTILTGKQLLLDYGVIMLILLVVPKATHLAFHLWLIPIALYWIARVQRPYAPKDVAYAVLMVAILAFTGIWKIPHYYSVYHTILFLKPATAAMIILAIVVVGQYFLPPSSEKK